MLNPAVNRTSVSNRARVATALLLACFSLSVAALRAGEGTPTAPAVPLAATATSQAGVAPVAATLPAAVVPFAALPASTAAPVGPVAPVRSVTPPVAPVDARPAPRQGPMPLVGAIYDASGGVVPGVEVRLRDGAQAASTAATTSTATSATILATVTTDVSGRFQFLSVAPGKYTLEASLPGFRTVRQAIELSVPRDWDRTLTLQLGSLMEKIVVTATRPSASAMAVQRQPARIKVGGNVRPPRKIFDMKPVYPASMAEAGREAVVSLDAVIGTDGSVTSVRVVSADIHPDFAIAAADAVRQWKFDSDQAQRRAGRSADDGVGGVHPVEVAPQDRRRAGVAAPRGVTTRPARYRLLRCLLRRREVVVHDEPAAGLLLPDRRPPALDVHRLGALLRRLSCRLSHSPDIVSLAPSCRVFRRRAEVASSRRPAHLLR